MSATVATIEERITEAAERSRKSLLDQGLERVSHGESIYFRGGVGRETIVLLHGANDQAGTWCGVVAALRHSHRLILPDLAGHGESGPSEGAISMPAMLAQIEAIIDAENASEVTLVGNSMGGWIAILFALAHPIRVKRLILEDSSGLRLPAGVPLLPRTPEEALRALRAVHGPEFPLEEWWSESILARTLNSPMLRVAASGDLLAHCVDARLAELSMPVTLIWGEHDGVLPLAYAEVFRRSIRGAVLKVISRAAHIPHLQQPQRFLEVLSSALV